MKPLSYARETDPDRAIAAVAADPGAVFLAGGTTEVDLIRIGVARPDKVVDINELPLAEIEARPDGSLHIGALARMSAVAADPVVRERFPLISESLILGASAQLRNMASIGGNLRQRVRCSYFRDGCSACNKREPGSGCAALEGVNRGHAILGTSDRCIATHPSDVAVAFVALDAVVQVRGPQGERTIPIDDFYLLPGDTPDREHPLEHGELIVAVEVPPLPAAAANSLYVKYRDRESYEFALTSVAGVMELDDAGAIGGARIALGGVATKPWRARQVEQAIAGQAPGEELFRAAAAAELAAARPRPMNAFKVELARNAIVRALTILTRGAAR